MPDSTLDTLKKKGKVRTWFWPAVIGGMALLAFALMYGFSTFISEDAQGVDYAFEKGAKTIATLGVTWVLVRLYAILGMAIYQRRLGTPMPRFMISSFNWAIVLMSIMFIIIVIFEKPAWSIIAAGGFIGAGLALALQGLILDIFSGVVLDVENNFKSDEWIRLPGGEVGRIIKSSWRSVTVQTPEGIIQVIPNGKLTSEGYQNLSRPLRGFYDNVEVALDHDIPIRRAERLLHGALVTIPEISKDKLFEAFASKATEGGISYKLRYHVGDYSKYREIRHKVLEAVTRHLHGAGFKISETIGEYALSKAPGELTLRDELQAEDLLPKIEMFQSLSSNEMKKLATKIDRFEVTEGADIIKQGETGSSMFIVGEGSVEVLKEVKKKGKITSNSLAFLGPNDFFGDMALLLGEKRTATVRAKSPSVIFEIPKTALEPILKKRPALAKSLSEVVAARQLATAQTMAKHKKKATQDAMTANQILKGIKKFFGV